MNRTTKYKSDFKKQFITIVSIRNILRDEKLKTAETNYNLIFTVYNN